MLILRLGGVPKIVLFASEEKVHPILSYKFIACALYNLVLLQ